MRVHGSPRAKRKPKSEFLAAYFIQYTSQRYRALFTTPLFLTKQNMRAFFDAFRVRLNFISIFHKAPMKFIVYFFKIETPEAFSNNARAQSLVCQNAFRFNVLWPEIC